MSKSLNHSRYRRYLKDPDSQGQAIENPHVSEGQDTASATIRIFDESGWQDLLNPLSGLGNRAYRKIGGFVRDGETRLDESQIRARFPDLPDWPGNGGTVTVTWHHLTRSLVGGYSIGGSNFVGPGASVLYFARPVSLFDLIAKIHDFAYEINGLVFNRPFQPEAFWSRLAKADWIFEQMLYAAGLELPIHWLADRFAKHCFYADPSLFRAEDRFINPFQAIPKSWLMAPPNYLVEEPKCRVSGPRRGQRSGIVMLKPDPYVVTESDQANLWKELIGSEIPSKLTNALEMLGENFPDDPSEESQHLKELMEDQTAWASLRDDAWEKEIPLSEMS